MKIMHLADLHLGKSILEQSLIDDQRYILKQIILQFIQLLVEWQLQFFALHWKHISEVLWKN